MDPEDPDDPDRSQNLITSSFYHFRHILKILSKYVHKFLSYLVHKQTDGHTNPGENITSFAEVTSVGLNMQAVQWREKTFHPCCAKLHDPLDFLSKSHQ